MTLLDALFLPGVFFVVGIAIIVGAFMGAAYLWDEYYFPKWLIIVLAVVFTWLGVGVMAWAGSAPSPGSWTVTA